MRRRSLVLLLALGLLAAVPSAVVAPTAAGAAAGVRYLDPVFSQVTTTKDVTYGSAVNDKGQTQTLKLDVYRPTGDALTNRPAVVYVHGGAFFVGTKEVGAPWATDLAQRGYVAVSISYRLSTGDPRTQGTETLLQSILDAQHDAQAAVRFLRSHAATYGIDPDRIGINGGSAGAVTSLAVAYRSDDVGTSGTPGPSSAVVAAVANSGTLGATAQTAGDAPVLMLNGTADTTVPHAQAKATCDASTAAHLWCTLATFPGTGHTVGANEPELTKDLTARYFHDLLAPDATTAALRAGTPFLDSISFVHRQYRDLLLRDADPGGLDHWSDRVAHGVAPGVLVDTFAQSAELQRSVGTVTRSFLAYLGRPPDPSGLTYWVGKIRSGTSVGQVNASLAASSEFRTRQASLTDEQFVDDLYAAVLARPADAAGEAHWLAKLDDGATRSSVVAAFIALPESIRATAPDVAVAIGTLGLLGRAPTTAEREEWVPQLRAGTPAADWYAHVLASSEYEARVTP